jgi:radical SAM superfamily enzyme YgiQ (UPF0313 family)
MTLDFLFVHPSTHFKRPPTPQGADILSYVVMPVGTLALADLLSRNGFETRIVHTAIEQALNPDFHIREVLTKYDPQFVGIDLHWYVHAYDALRLAQQVRDLSSAQVVLGGYTASFFADEIISEFPCVDVVIRGDAERPLLELLQHQASHDYAQIPNLVYQQNRVVKHSNVQYIADEETLNQLNFTNFPLLNHFEQYLKLALSVELGYSNLKKQTYPCLGRGCTADCTYCGAGQNAQRALTGAEKPLFISPENVIQQLQAFTELQIDSVYMGFDPCAETRSYHHALFSLIRQEGLDLGCQFELWDLVSRDFIKDFRRTFNPLFSSFVHSIQSGSEAIRKLNVGFPYTNETLFRWLDNLKAELVPVEVAFAAGLPGETIQHFDQTIRLAQRIRENYPMVLNMYCIPLTIEPNSPMFLAPEKYGVTLKFQRFRDYYDFFANVAQGLPFQSVLGYETDKLTEPQILDLSQRFYATLMQPPGQSAPSFSIRR